MHVKYAAALAENSVIVSLEKRRSGAITEKPGTVHDKKKDEAQAQRLFIMVPQLRPYRRTDLTAGEIGEHTY